MSKGFSKWIYRLTLARWYYNYAWGWVIGYFLSTFTERVYWNAMVVLLKKEMARTPDAEVQKCVEQMKMYINGQVPFNFDELDNFQLGEQQDLSAPLSKNVTKLSIATDVDDGPETAVKG